MMRTPARSDGTAGRGIFRAASFWLCTLLLAGCADRFDPETFILPTVGPPPDTGPPIGTDSQLDIPHPLFAGLGGLLAGDGYVRLDWQPATDDDSLSENIVYHVFQSSVSGGHDFTAPPTLITAPGATSAEFNGLPNAQEVYYVVRAVDELGNVDPNEVEWAAMPNPVRYVRPGGSGPDGLTPATAYDDILIAAVLTQGMQDGVNFWVSEGIFSTRVFVWPGRSIYGGFDTSFDPATRDPETFETEVETSFSDIAVVTMRAPTASSILFNPGALATIDGFSIHSAPVVVGGVTTFPARAGVRAEDGLVRISNCLIFNVVSQGIDLQSDFLNSVPIIGSVRNCTIQGVGGEGIFIEGTTDLVIDNNVISDTGTEGIESQWVHASGNATARIELTRNRITNAGDEGIDLDFAEEDVNNPLNSLGARIRAFIRNNRVEGAGLQGIQLDLDFQNSDEIDFRGRIEDNEINNSGLDGILLDGDARGSFRVARNSITGNGTAPTPPGLAPAAGIAISGSAGGPYARLLHNRIIGNRVGISVTGAISADVQHQIFRANRGPAVVSDRAVVTVSNSILMENGGEASPTTLRYSLVFDEPIPATADGTVLDPPEDPLLQNHPLFYTRATGNAGGGNLPLASTIGFLIDDTLEVRNDGVARTVISVGPTGIGFAPATAISNGDLIAAWGTADSVIEREGFFLGSPAIGTGDPLESNRDGTPADLGPIGGDTPGNIGIETAIPLESAALELVAIDPSPSELQTGAVWSLSFNRDLVPEIADLVTFSRNGVPLIPTTVTVGERTIDFDFTGVAFMPGEAIDLEIVPGEFTVGAGGAFDGLGGGGGDLVPPGLGIGGGEILLFPSRTVFSSVIGLDSTDLDPLGPEQNGTVATAQGIPTLPTVVSGALGVLGDVDVFAIDLAAGETIQPELYVRQIESALTTRLTLIGSDGTTTISTDAAVLPFYFDPVLPQYTAPTAQTVYLRVQSAFNAGDITEEPNSPVGDYELIVR